MARLSPKHMPAGTDGQADLFFAEGSLPQFMAVSSTGCIAVQAPDQPQIRVFYWHYRMKGGKCITLPAVPWCILWSCRAPWNTESCGHITRLHVSECGLTNIDVRELSRLAHLRCNRNLLERLDCSGMEYLTTLDCSGNELTHLNVEGCVRLRKLFAAGNFGLRQSSSELLAIARGEPSIFRRKHVTSTSLFDL